VADTVYTRALAQAIEMHGSTQALAFELRVPENTLQRWISGRAQMPLQAFHRAVALLTAHEQRASAPAEDAALTESVAFSIEGVSAHCARCGAIEFLSPVPRNALRMTTRLECASCKAGTTYGEMVGALATLAVRQARSVNSLSKG
jgi:hypothetical protein